MSIVIKNDKGEDQTVYTQAELDAQKAEVTKEVETMKAQVADTEKKLKEAVETGGNPHQIERLRKERDEAIKAADGATKAAKDVEGRVGNLENNFTKEYKDDLLDSLSGGNKELREKLEFHYDKTISGTPVDKKGIKEKMGHAYQIATGSQAKPGLLDAVPGVGSGRGNPPKDMFSEPESENSKAMRNTFKISDEEVKKYEERKKNNPNQFN